MTSKYIVTGVAGFIGSHLAERLVARGDEVIGIDCITDYYSESIKRSNLENLLAQRGFKFIEKNIVDVDWGSLLRDVSAVFHQAAQAGVRASWGANFKIYTDLNILATQVLLEALKGTGIRMVYASSSSVYGDTQLLPMREDHRPSPQSPYGVSKLAAEHLAVLYWRNFQVPTVSLRYFTVYGPRQRPDMAFHRFIKAGINGEPIQLYGDGTQTRDFTFISDAIDANLLAAEKGEPGGVYNIGGGSRTSMNDVIGKIEKLLERPLNVQRKDAQKGDVRHTYADTARAREQLGFAPKISIDEGLTREVEWVQNYLALLV